MGFPCGGGSLVMVGFPCGAGFPYGGDSFVCVGIPLCWGFPCGGRGFPSGEFPMWGDSLLKNCQNITLNPGLLLFIKLYLSWTVLMPSVIL